MEVIGIRCGSHTLQLAVDDAIKKVAHLNSIINKGHAAAVEFRKRYVLKRIRELQPDAKVRKTVLDVPTRWGSVYDMHKSVLDNKRFAFALK